MCVPVFVSSAECPHVGHKVYNFLSQGSLLIDILSVFGAKLYQ